MPHPHLVPTRRVRMATVPALVLAVLAALVPLPAVAAPDATTTADATARAATSQASDPIGDPEGREWEGYVGAEPHEFRPDVTPPRIDLHAGAYDGPDDLFVAGATARVIDWWGQRVVTDPLPLTVVDGGLASLTPPPLPEGHYAFEVVSGGRWSRTAFDVLTPKLGHGIWFDHDQPTPAGATEVTLTASGAFLDASTRITRVTRFRGGDPVANAAAGVRFELIDEARGRLVFTDPLRVDDEVHVSFADGQGFRYGDIYLWVQPPGAELRGDQLLLGSTRGAVLEVDPGGFRFDATATARVRTYGRVLPTGTTGTPTVASDGSLRVPVTAELDAGWYELRVTAGGERFDLPFRVGPAQVELWSEDLVRDVDTGRAWFTLAGLGQGWDGSTRVSLLQGATVIATTTPEVDTSGASQYLDGELTIPAGTTGIRTLRVSHRGANVDLPVRVSGPKLWLDGSVDSKGGMLAVFPDGFSPARGDQLTVRTDTGRTVATVTVSAAQAEEGYLEVPLSAATGVSILTASMTHRGATYTGRTFNGWFDGGVEGLLGVDPAVSPPASRPSSFQFVPSPGTFGPSLLSTTWRSDGFDDEPVAAPLPTRVNERLARQSYPGGLLDGYHEVVITDGDLAWFGYTNVGSDDERLPNLEAVPYQLPRGAGAGTVVTIESRNFPFSAGTLVTLLDDDAEVPGGVRSVQVVSPTRLRVTLGKALADGLYDLEVDVNGGYDLAQFVVGPVPGGGGSGGPTWASNAALTASNVNATSLTLTWPAASSSSPPVTYSVFRGAAKVAGSLSGTSTTVTGLTPDTPYTFTVLAQDGQGATSSRTLQLTTRTRAVTTSPAHPPRCRDAQPANFDDVPLTYTHALAVFCAAGHGLVLGKPGGTTFDPGGTLTRGQLASIVLRSLEASRIHLTAERAGFRDIAGSPHATAIRKLSAAGVIQGKSDTAFDPQGKVTRGQLMTLLDRASKLLVEAYPAVPGPRFADTAGSPHAGAVDRLNAAGVAQGLKDGRSFGPNLSVNRGQAASFVTRWLEDQANRRAS